MSKRKPINKDLERVRIYTELPEHASKQFIPFRPLKQDDFVDMFKLEVSASVKKGEALILSGKDVVKAVNIGDGGPIGDAGNYLNAHCQLSQDDLVVLSDKLRDLIEAGPQAWADYGWEVVTPMELQDVLYQAQLGFVIQAGKTMSEQREQAATATLTNHKCPNVSLRKPEYGDLVRYFYCGVEYEAEVTVVWDLNYNAGNGCNADAWIVETNHGHTTANYQLIGIKEEY